MPTDTVATASEKQETIKRSRPVQNDVQDADLDSKRQRPLAESGNVGSYPINAADESENAKPSAEDQDKMSTEQTVGAGEQVKVNPAFRNVRAHVCFRNVSEPPPDTAWREPGAELQRIEIYKRR